MTPEELQNKIAEYFAKLPADMQAMFASMDWMKTLENTSAKFNLTELQIQSLGTETTLLLLGIIHPNEFDNFIHTEMSLPKDTADKILVEINLGILNKWRKDLEGAYDKNVAGEAERVYGGDVKLDDRFAKLPPEVKDAIINSNYQTELASMAKAQGLSIDDMGKLEQVVNKVMLGIDHPETFEQNIKSALGTDTTKANTIATAVNEKVFKNIREVLKSHSEAYAEPAMPMPSSAQSVAPRFATEPDMPPLPPAKQAMANPSPIFDTSPSDNIMQKSGIEIQNEPVISAPAPISNTAIDSNLIQKAGVSIIEDKPMQNISNIQDNIATEQELMNGIENPSSIKVAPVMKPNLSTITPPAPSTPSPDQNSIDIIQSKLSSPSVSVRGTSSQGDSLHKSDPYREPIE